MTGQADPFPVVDVPVPGYDPGTFPGVAVMVAGVPAVVRAWFGATIFNVFGENPLTGAIDWAITAFTVYADDNADAGDADWTRRVAADHVRELAAEWFDGRPLPRYWPDAYPEWSGRRR